MEQRIVIVLAIEKEETNKHFRQVLGPLVASINAKGAFPFVELAEMNMIASTPDKVRSHVDEFISRKEACMVLLLGDWLVTPGYSYVPTEAAQNLLEKFRSRAFATVAITRYPHRVADIDRTVAPNCPKDALGRALDLSIQRLEYLNPPEHRPKIDPTNVTVRLLRSGNETEFKDYFSLRHRIYKIMGYLEAEVEECRSQLEINEADTHSIHVGAFYKMGFHEVLIGATRVVMNTVADEVLNDLCNKMARNDPVLKKRLETPDGLSLPIFQTHRGMNKVMRETYRNNQTCGELSRVTVDREYRGGGLSRKLVELALNKAIQAGVDRMFLECLEIHEPLYKKHGFSKLEGMKCPVATVGRTMIAMEMEQKQIEQIQTKRPGDSRHILRSSDNLGSNTCIRP